MNQKKQYRVIFLQGPTPAELRETGRSEPLAYHPALEKAEAWEQLAKRAENHAEARLEAVE